MKIRLSETYSAYKQEILDIIDRFDSNGENFVIGKRNTIKLFYLDEIQINIKSFRVPNIFNRIVYRFFRKSKAERSFENATYLQKCDIGTPAPVAFLECNKSILFGRSYYISKHLEVDLLYKDLVENPNYPDREKILRAFVHFTHALHENQILFKDHSPGNTLIQKNGEEYKFYLVDLNRIKFTQLSLEERIANFTRLSPHKEMVAIMSDEYAKITGEAYEKVFGLMWGITEEFQRKFYRKIALKNKYLFWRKKR